MKLRRTKGTFRSGTARRPLQLAVGVALLLASGPSLSLAGDSISFRNDVMAVLAKAGCSSGVCHGNLNGKGGFKLSLRGEDPRFDRLSLTRDRLGRRINRLDPDRSLILLKPTGQVAHEGGRRFGVDSEAYRVLRDWIARGMLADPPTTPTLEGLEVTPRERVLIAPEQTVQLRVTARFSDGSSRDRTKQAVYAPVSPLATVSADGVVRRSGFGETTILVRYLHAQVPVRLAFVPARPDFVWCEPVAVNEVDRHIDAKLKRLRMNPSAVCGDSAFVRRAFLDLLGILPTRDEARAFVSHEQTDKRARLIDRLLDRPEFAGFWALKWADLLRTEEHTLDRKGVLNLHRWIRQSIADGKPLDRFARELIAARGSTYTNPPTNYYRALRDPLTRGESTAQLFLGVRLSCAKCHNHPFDRWTQRDYYGWNALFARVRYKVLENRRKIGSDRHEFIGEQVVWMDRRGELNDPRTGEPARPLFLGASTPAMDADQDRLEALADWITSPENPFFARAQVNRIWYHLMGRGLVEPIDDFRATNPPINEPLLEYLTADFIEHAFDLRHIIRVIMRSRTYQASVIPNETNRADETNFSHALVRRISAEPLLDAITQVLDVPVQFNGYPLGVRAGQLPGVAAIRYQEKRPSGGDRFLKLFGKPQRLIACECERSDETTVAQAFQLISSETINGLIAHENNRLTRLLASDRSNAEMIDELYWTALSRPPTAEERTTMVAYLDRADVRRTAIEDITWALISSTGFVLRR